MGDKSTIVGPEPDRSAGEPPSRGVHLQALLLMAKYDDAFRELLLSDRDRAIVRADLPLTPSEGLLLRSVSNDQLLQNIEQFRVPGVNRTSLPSWAKAAAVVMLLASVALSATNCFEIPVVTGSAPDSTHVTPDTLAIDGIVPD